MLQWPMLNRALECLKVIDHIRILGIGLELTCNGGSCRGISFALRTRCMNLACKLVPVQYQEYEYGLLACITLLQLYTCTTSSTKLSEEKPITTRSYTFSDALRLLHVCKSSFDWFT